MSKFYTKGSFVISIVSLLAAWWIASVSGGISKTLIATPAEVVGVFIKAIDSDARASEQVFVHIWHTLGRAFAGWSVSVLIGLVCGVIAGRSRLLYRLLEPAAEFIRAIPPVLAFPLLLVAFNYGSGAYTYTIVFGCVPVMFLTVARGIEALPVERQELIRVMGTPLGIRTAAMFLDTLPSIFLAARLCLSFAVIIAVVTEMVFTPRTGYALGALARDAEIEFNTPVFYAGVISMGVVGFLLNWLLRKGEEMLGGKHQS